MKHKLLILLALIGISASLRAGNSQANDLVRDANGNILTVGLANSIVDRTTDYALARYLPTGELDPTFNPLGEMPGQLQIDISMIVPQTDAVVLTPVDEGLSSVAIDPSDNKIVAVGFSGQGLDIAIAVLKLNPDGSLDQDFNANNQFGLVNGLAVINLSEFPGITEIATGITSDLASDVVIDSQGRIVIVGSRDDGVNLDLFVVRLLSNGQLDPTFNTQSSTPGIFTLALTNVDLTRDDLIMRAVALNPDDSIIVGGTLVARVTNNTGRRTEFLVVKVTEGGCTLWKRRAWVESLLDGCKEKNNGTGITDQKSQNCQGT